MKREVKALLILLGVGAVGPALFAQTTEYFLQYPGGYTEAVYRIFTENLKNPIELSWEIEEESDSELKVTTRNEIRAQRNELENGVLNGIAQTQLIVQDEAVRALLENRASLTPNTTFIVPGGARFVTRDIEFIQGVEATCGLLTKEDKPDERTILAITKDPTLPFPPFIQFEKTREGASVPVSPLPYCLSVQPLLQTSKPFLSIFQLQLTEFERRE